MVFWKMSLKHKLWFLFWKLIVICAIVSLGLLAASQVDITLVTNSERTTASIGVIAIIVVVIAAVSGRLNTIFKIKSVGFVLLFVLFLGVEQIVVPVRLAIGYILIPLLIDDCIIMPAWKNIWYNTYDGVVKLHE